MTLDVSRELDERFELVAIDPATWLETGAVSNVQECTVTRDASSETLESATVEVYGDIPNGYYRAYWISKQRRVEGREPVATFFATCPEVTHDGKTEKRSCQGYSPLMEPSKAGPEAGWFVPANSDIAQSAADIIRAHCRAPVEEPSVGLSLDEAFVADGTESWLSFAASLLSKAAMHFEIDPWGRVSVAPDLLGAPKATHSYSEDSSTIVLSGGLRNKADWYDVPNVVTVIWSSSGNDDDDPDTLTGEARNDDPNSPVSTVTRGYEVTNRETNPDGLPDIPSQEDVDLMSEMLLEQRSSVAREIGYEHPYNGSRLGEGVMLDFPSVGAHGPATVTWQAIKMQTGCTVEEVASMNERLWTR